MVNARNIFIFGNSSSGKSTLSARIASYLSDKKSLKKLILLMYQVLVRRIQIFYDLTAEFGIPNKRSQIFWFIKNQNCSSK